MIRILALSLFFSLIHAAEKPNVIIIFTDDQGYADLSCYGAEKIRTPHLDKLATQGSRFTNFHVAQAVCSASRAALLTGCYPNRIGIHGALGPDATHGIADSERTIAEMFRDLGYATGMAGKWHLGHHQPFLPVNHGFEEWLGLPYSNDMWPVVAGNESKPYGSPPFRGNYPALPLIENNGTIVKSPVTSEDQETLTHDYTQRCLNFIERNKEKPFFFYLAHSMPHVPLFASKNSAAKSKAGIYGDVIEEIDHNVGRITALLEKHQLTDNTIIIYTSDNGPWHVFGEHGGSTGPLREAKGTTWEGGIRVPCIMSWPGHIPANAENKNYLMTIDLMPTLARVTGGTLPSHPIDGKDVWPLILQEKNATSPHTSYWNYYAMNELQAITSGDGKWKLMLPHAYRSLGPNPKPGKDGAFGTYVQQRVKEPELYQLDQDPGEKTNVADQHPDIVKKLLAEATKARNELGDSITKTRGSANRPPDQLKKKKTP